jgi:hypothetical protein
LDEGVLEKYWEKRGLREERAGAGGSGEGGLNA